MTPLQIRSPIWKTNSIGIATYKVGNLGIDVEVTYTDKEGKRLWPDVYHISREKIIEYPIKRIDSHVSVYIVPIEDLVKKEVVCQTK